MTPLRVSIFAAIASILLLLVILELIRSRRLQERYALLWVMTAVVLLVFSTAISELAERNLMLAQRIALLEQKLKEAEGPQSSDSS
jgi:hypothetical protein